MKTIAISMLIVIFPFLAKAQETYKLDENYDINLTGTINLTTNDADVKITGSNRSDVHLKVYRNITTKGFVWGDDKFSMDVKSENGNLYISDDSRGSHISIAGYTHEEYTIDIEVPLGVSLDIVGDDDDYIIKNIGGAISLKVDDGDTELYNCSGTDFHFNLDDGDIKMDGGSGSLYVRLDDGDIEIKDASFSTIEASIDDGDLVISTSLADNGQYSFRGDDSDIIFTVTGGGGNFDIDHDDSHLYATGNFETVRKEEDYTQLKLANGSANIKMRVDDASIRLNTK